MRNCARGGEMGMDSPDPGDGRMHGMISLGEMRISASASKGSGRNSF